MLYQCIQQASQEHIYFKLRLTKSNFDFKLKYIPIPLMRSLLCVYPRCIPYVVCVSCIPYVTLCSCIPTGIVITVNVYLMETKRKVPIKSKFTGILWFTGN